MLFKNLGPLNITRTEQEPQRYLMRRVCGMHGMHVWASLDIRGREHGHLTVL